MPETTQTSAPALHWSDIREAGTLRGILFLAWVNRVFGRGVFSVVLLPVAVYFFLFRRMQRRASREFLNAHFEKYPQAWKSRPGNLDVIRHFYSFGQSILDKLLAWTTEISEDEFDVVAEETARELVEDPQGQLIIGSHFGNLEYCRGFMQRNKSRVINALVYDRHSANFVDMMQKLNPESRINIYQVDELDIPLILNLQKKVSEGEWLFVAGDRLPLSGVRHSTRVDFLDRPARFPIGPYMLAKTLGCRVRLMFACRIHGKVRLSVQLLADRIELPHATRNADLRDLAQTFASALEDECRQAPFQWFNFFPFWDEGENVAETDRDDGLS